MSRNHSLQHNTHLLPHCTAGLQLDWYFPFGECSLLSEFEIDSRGFKNCSTLSKNSAYKWVQNLLLLKVSCFYQYFYWSIRISIDLLQFLMIYHYFYWSIRISFVYQYLHWSISISIDISLFLWSITISMIYHYFYWSITISITVSIDLCFNLCFYLSCGDPRTKGVTRP